MSDALTRPLRFALLLSLALNAALAGVLGGLWLRADDRVDAAAARDDEARAPSPGRLGRDLAPEQRRLMREIFDEHRAAMRERIAATRAARHAVAQALRADPFDREALAAAFAALRGRDAEAAEESHAMLLDLAGRLDADGRARLAARIERGDRHREGHHRRAAPPERRE